MGQIPHQCLGVSCLVCAAERGDFDGTSIGEVVAALLVLAAIFGAAYFLLPYLDQLTWR